jgi:hypothetical protein
MIVEELALSRHFLITLIKSVKFKSSSLFFVAVPNPHWIHDQRKLQGFQLC